MSTVGGTAETDRGDIVLTGWAVSVPVTQLPEYPQSVDNDKNTREE